MESVYSLITHDVVGLQFVSLSTQSVVANSNQLAVKENQEKTEKWTSCSESDPSDPGYVAWYYLQVVTGNTAALKGKIDPVDKAGNPSINPATGKAFVIPKGAWNLKKGDLVETGSGEGWVDLFINGNSHFYNDYSSSFMMQAYHAASEWTKNNPKSSLSPTNLLSHMSDLLQSKGQVDEQTGKNEISLFGNLAQHFETADPVTDVTQSLLSGMNQISGDVVQISA